jgi:adenosylcobinamide-phosphate synthase
MWGYRGIYKGQNWEWAGKWAAWADDGLSWIPARITAGLLALVFWWQALASASPQVIDATRADPNAPDSTRFMARLRAEARRTASPNSGWPMAAMALALGVRLQKPGVYVLNAAGREALAQDTQLATVYAAKALVALVFLAQAALISVAIMGAV